MKALIYTIIITLLTSYNVYSQTFIDEDFNTNTMPTGWTPYATSGTQQWEVGLTNTINGHNLTGYLAFDDDAAGDTGVRNLAGISTNTFNITNYINDPNLKIEFTLGFFFDTVDTDDRLWVDLYNPTNGHTMEIFSKTTDLVAVFNNNVSLNSTEILNFQDDLQLVVFYDDANASWGWGAGISKVKFKISPINDYMGSLNLPIGTSFNDQVYTANNFGATNNANNDPTMSCSGNSINQYIWFKLTVPDTGNVIIETREVAGSNMDDSILAIYSGTFGNLTEIACNDDINNTNIFSKIALTSQTPGEELFVRVVSYDDLNYGKFNIAAYDETPPTYNDCATPLNVTVGTTFNDSVQVLDNTNSTFSTIMPLPTCLAANFSTNGDVWLNVIVPANGNLTLETLDVSGGDLMATSITAYTGTCTNLTEIACSLTGTGGNVNDKLELTNLTAGDNLLVRVYAFGPFINGVSEQGMFQFAAYNDATADIIENNITGLGFPNPIKDNVTITAQEKITKITIYNLLGKQVLQEQPNTEISNVDVSKLTTGIYLIKIEAANKVSTQKIIKQ